MNPKRRFYSGNYPNNRDYDPSLPIGYIKWDADDGVNYEGDEPEEIIPDEPEMRDGEVDTDWKN